MSNRSVSTGGRARDFASAGCAAEAPLQLVFPLRLIPRLGPVVQGGAVIAAGAYWDTVVVVVLVRVGGRDAVFGERADLVAPDPVRTGISGCTDDRLVRIGNRAGRQLGVGRRRYRTGERPGPQSGKAPVASSVGKHQPSVFERCPYCVIMQLDLTDDEKLALAELLRSTIKNARYPLSPQLAPLKAMLAKLEAPEPRPEPLPPLKGGMAARRRWRLSRAARP